MLDARLNLVCKIHGMERMHFTNGIAKVATLTLMMILLIMKCLHGCEVRETTNTRKILTYIHRANQATTVLKMTTDFEYF